MVDLMIAVVLGLVEGLTEFIPVSSTGHLIVAGHLLGFTGAKADTFEVVIQLGAILAVVVHYRQRLLDLATLRPSTGFGGRHGVGLLALTTLPALVFGALAHDFIKAHLFSPVTVAIGLGLGGVAILLVERFHPVPRYCGLDALRWQEALAVGLFQCLALWPGVSRSAATILGGMLGGVARKTAAEYSFLAAVPVIAAATILDLYQSRGLLALSDLPTFAVGFVVAFVSAWIALRFFLRLLATMTLRPFGWYRIVAAFVLLAVLWGRS
ncbi:MAG: undecaprenyl-diphosphate phosphatase [Thermomicrobiales bacterium]